MNIGYLEYAYLYDMTKDELLEYLKIDLDFNDDTYPYLNHKEVLNMSEANLRQLIIEIIDENEHSMIISED